LIVAIAGLELMEAASKDVPADLERLIKEPLPAPALVPSAGF
jgi:hypothetical protein